MPRPPKPLNPYASWPALFGATVRHLRTRFRPKSIITQQELGKRIGYDGSTVSAVERGVLCPDRVFVKNCERELEADGVLEAMHPFVVAEWDNWNRQGVGAPPDPGNPPPDALLTQAGPPSTSHLHYARDGAYEVLQMSGAVGVSDVGRGTLENIDRAVDRFCRDYPSAPPALLLTKAKRHLGYVLRLLDGKKTLAQHRHLLVAAGWLTLLMACLQYDVGDREAAEASRDTALQLGTEAEHQEIAAWAFELLAWFARVDGRYEDVFGAAESGSKLAPNTSAGIQLALQGAKAWSRLQDHSRAESAMRQAAAALATRPTPSHPEHHFVFDSTKLSFYAATCYSWLGAHDRAEEHAQHVITQCFDTPGDNPRWPMRLAETRIVLGHVALHHGKPEEAAYLGAQALESQRKSGETLRRVGELDSLLQSRFSDSPDVRDLHDQYVALRTEFDGGA